MSTNAGRGVYLQQSMLRDFGGAELSEMSINAMNLVWSNFRRGGSEQLCMLALADWSDDDGGFLYPSIKSVAEKIGASECQARRILHGFIAEGLLIVVGNEHGGKPGTTRRYQLNIDMLKSMDTTRTDATRTASTDATPRMDATPSTHARRRVAPMHETGSTGATQSIREPSIEPPKGKRSSFDAAAIDLPAWLDRSLWLEWVAHRKEIREPLKERGCKMQIEALTGWRDAGHDVAGVIRNSIRNGYQGLIEPRTKPGSMNGSAVHHAGRPADRLRTLLDDEVH